MSEVFLYGTGGGKGEDLEEVLTEQEELIESLKEALENKIAVSKTDIVPLTVTENGTYTAPEGQAYSPVEVNVAGSGGDQAEALIARTLTDLEYSGTQIGDYAFYNCTALSTINIPNVTSIGNYAFGNCNLGNINLPKVTSIGQYAFYGNSGNIHEVTAPLLTSIGDYAFRDSGVERLSFPELTTIGRNAFHSSKVISANLPKVTTLGQQLFYYCSYLKTVDFSLATSIPSQCFYECSALESVNFPSATSVSSGVFRYCKNLQSVNIPLATSIGSVCFNSCVTLPELVLPSVTSLSSESLGGTPMMQRVDIYKKCPIATYTFYSCHSLTTLILRSEIMCTLANINAFQNCYHYYGTVNETYNPDGLKDGYIYVPSALVDSYKIATNWSTFADRFRAIEDYPEICGEV